MKPSPSIFAYETQVSRPLPSCIEVRGAHVHNLKDVDIDIPLNSMVGIAGISGSGKSSLALGVLYAEGSRRYLEALSTYTRRRMTQASRATVDEVRHIPAALALHQRPSVPGVRSTFGTMSELLNSLRLLFSRIARVRTLRSTQPTHDERCRRASDALHVLRRTHASAISGGSRIQRRARVSDMLRHRNHEGSRPFRLGTG